MTYSGASGDRAGENSTTNVYQKMYLTLTWICRGGLLL